MGKWFYRFGVGAIFALLLVLIHLDWPGASMVGFVFGVLAARMP